MSDEQVKVAAMNEVAGSVIEEKPHLEFGLHLAKARQAAGLTTRDVADRLKLHEDIIKALDESRLDILPAAAFTQGYIKAYAKLLKISPDAIMCDYHVMVPSNVVSLAVPTGVPAEHSSRDVIVKGTSYALIALALILFIFWIQQSGFELSGNLVQQIENVDLSLGDTADSEPVLETNRMVERQNEPAMEVQPLPAPVSVVAINKKEVVVEKQPSVVMPEFKREEPKTELKPVIRSPVIAEKRVATGVEANREENVAAVVAVEDVIKLSASAESWAEVQDADNNRLFYSLIKADGNYAIKGRAPFKVFLGNAPSVSIEVNNQAVDISRYVRPSKIAHVKINAKAATQFGGARDTNQVTDQYIPETPAGVSRTE